MNWRILRRTVCGFLAVCLAFLCFGCGPKQEDTDLKGEGLNGVAVDSVYEGTKAEQAFGRLFRTDTVSGEEKCYNYFSDQNEVSVSVRNQKVTGLYSEWLLHLNGKTVTKRGISNTSSLDEIIRAYGKNDVRVDYNNQMGMEDYYVIRYQDSKDRIGLTFRFLKGETSNCDITFQKY